jgi:hypothetical protein
MLQDYIHVTIFLLVSIPATATIIAALGKDNKLHFDKVPAKGGVRCPSGRYKILSFISDIVLPPSV